MKPILCPFSDFCKESENRYEKCERCQYSKKRSYYKRVKKGG